MLLFTQDFKDNALMALFLVGIFFIFELIYFRFATYLRIKDRPSSRSSHKRSTIRGGGIIFPLAWFVYFLCSDFSFPLTAIGVALVSFISFMDDVKSVSNKLRLIFHALAFTLCFYELGLLSILSWWGVLSLYIVSIGCINAINFMDGINGITGLNALSILVPLLIGSDQGYFQEPLIYIILAILVFLIFNFRTRAVCFAGDVGSVSLGYILIFLVLGLMFKLWTPEIGLLNIQKPFSISFELKYLLLLAVFGVDSILTIIQRLLLGENIFQAHRRHLFQLLSNECGWHQLLVSSLYGFIQLVITLWVLYTTISISQVILVIFLMTLIYIISKFLIYRLIIQKV